MRYRGNKVTVGLIKYLKTTLIAPGKAFLLQKLQQLQ